ncbi:hypothetical protein KCU71_g11190, partial [Aureobasidium melanogenum]
MAEPAGLTMAVLAFTGPFYNAASACDSVDHADLLREYSMYMKVLEGCVSSNSFRAKNPPSVISNALDRCTDLGEELVCQQVGSSLRVPVAWDKLEAKFDGFRRSVMLLHELIQDLTLNDLLERQKELVLASQKQAIVHYADHVQGPGWLSSFSDAFANKLSQVSMADLEHTVTFAEGIIARSVERGMQFDNDPSEPVGTIIATHEGKPRYVPVKAKYDTGSEANFIAAGFLKEHNLSALLQKLPKDDWFRGMNECRYPVTYTITLDWCASTMNKVRKTQFYVVEEVPFDIIIGNPFILDNRVFQQSKVALPCRYEHLSAGKYP